jgi:hypothetical protein
MKKKAKSERKNRSVTCKKSQTQIWSACIREIGRPLLTSWLVGSNFSHILLDGSLAHPNTQFQEFSPNLFSSPKPIVYGHLPDQGNGFGCDRSRVLEAVFDLQGMGLKAPVF